ncbi:MAG: hypothetical protein ACRCTS_09810, partial [Fusobacteriaceae bacterium]
NFLMGAEKMSIKEKNREFVKDLRKHYKDYLLHKVLNCYKKEMEISFDKLVSEMENLLEDNEQAFEKKKE